MNNKEEKKNNIIKKSIGLMYLRGYNGTSVKDITDSAGIPKGSFYNYFKDKEQYAVEALSYYQLYMRKDRIDILSNPKLSPLDRIRSFFREGCENVTGYDFKLGCFAGNLSQEMGDISSSIANRANSFFQSIITDIYNNLVEAANGGTYIKQIDKYALSSFLVTSWQGTLLRVKTSQDCSLFDEFFIVLEVLLG